MTTSEYLKRTFAIIILKGKNLIYPDVNIVFFTSKATERPKTGCQFITDLYYTPICINFIAIQIYR